MLNIMHSEWIKLRTTKSLWWTSGLVLFFTVALALLIAGVAGHTLSTTTLEEDQASFTQAVYSLNGNTGLNGFLSFGTMIILIQGVMMVTSEYSTGTAKSTLLAAPKRWRVPLAKFFVYGGFTAVLSFLSMVWGTAAARWALGWKVNDPAFLNLVGFGVDNVWALIGRGVLYSVLLVALALGVGYIVRHTAGGIALLLLWQLVVETAVVPMIPKIRDWLPPYMPFGNGNAAIQWQAVADAPWGPLGSLLYFAAWTLGVFVVGIVLLKRRDA